MFEIIEFMLVFEASDCLQKFVYDYTGPSILTSDAEGVHNEDITDEIGEDVCHNADDRRICSRSDEQDADTSCR